MFPWNPGDKVLLSYTDRKSKEVVEFVELRDDGQCTIKDNQQAFHIVSVDRLSPYTPDVITRASMPEFQSTEETVAEKKTRQIRELSTQPTNIRRAILEDAAEIISNARDVSYGDPLVNFSRIAALWNEYLGPPHNIQPHDVAAMMLLLKVSRVAHNPANNDNWKDIAGYAALGFEVYERRKL